MAKKTPKKNGADTRLGKGIIPQDYAKWLNSLKSRIASAQQRAALAQYINGRRTDLTRETISNAFERWILDLDRATLGPDDTTQLRADIATFVDSMNGGGAGPGVCY